MFTYFYAQSTSTVISGRRPNWKKKKKKKEKEREGRGGGGEEEEKKKKKKTHTIIEKYKLQTATKYVAETV